MSAPRTPRHKQLLDLFSPYTDLELATAAATSLDESTKKMLEEKNVDLNALSNFNKLFNKVVLPYFVNQEIEKLPYVREATLAFLKEHKIEGSSVGHIVDECVATLENEFKKDEEGIHVFLPLNAYIQNLLAKLNTNFKSKVGSPLFYIIASCKVDDLKALFKEIEEEYATLKNKLGNIFDADFAILDSLTKKQVEAYEDLKVDLVERMNARIAREKIQYSIDYNTMEDTRSTLSMIVYQEKKSAIEKTFKDSVSPLLAEVFNNWIKDKIPGVREKFIGECESIISRVIFDATVKPLYERLRRQFDRDSQELTKQQSTAQEQKAPTANLKPAPVQSKVTESGYFVKASKQPDSSLIHKTKDFSEASKILAESKDKNWLLHRSPNKGLLAITFVDSQSDSGYKSNEFVLSLSKYKGDRWFEASKLPDAVTDIVSVGRTIEYASLKDLLGKILREHTTNGLTLDNLCHPTSGRASLFNCVKMNGTLYHSSEVWDKLNDDLCISRELDTFSRNALCS